MEGCPKALMINYDLKEVGPIDNAFEKPISDYIQDFYNENPQSYTQEVQQLTQLRKGIGSIPHDIQGCNVLRKYFTQLHYLQSRFPMGEGGAAAVPFVWYDVYSCDPVVYSDIRYEQACVLFNLGSLYSQLASNEDRLSDESMKAACTLFQNAAGCFQYLKDNFLLSDLTDMNEDILGLKITIMLGQALECILEKSIRDNRNATLIARIAIQVKTYFSNGITHLSKPGALDMGSSMQKMWKKHLKIKILCYEAIAYIYMGNDAELKEKYGEKVAYLRVASEKITEASKQLKNQPEKTVDTIRFVMDVVGNKYEGAVKDNDFIYHMGVPQTSALAEIEGVNFVKPLPFQYDDESTADIFHKLVPMKAHEASSLYSEKKDSLIRDIAGQIEQKDMQLSQFMSAMKIEDLIDPKEDELPDELLSRNKFLQDNPDIISKVEKDIEELRNLTAIVESMLKDIQDIVNNEKQLEELDETKELSSELNGFLAELEQCNNAHKQASKTNAELIKHATESQGMIQFLSGDPKSILSSLPSQNIIEAPADEPVVQRIREILGKVDKMRSQRLHLLKKLRSEVNQDDVTSKLVVRDKGNTDAFFDEELKKHNETISYINQNLTAQDNIIEALTEANAKYATTRQKVQSVSKKFNAQVQTYLNVISLFLEVKGRIRSGVEFYNQFESNVESLQKKVNEYLNMKNKTRKQKVPSRPTAKKPDIIRSNKPNLPAMQPLPVNHPMQIPQMQIPPTQIRPTNVPPMQMPTDPTRFSSPTPRGMLSGVIHADKTAFDHARFPGPISPNSSGQNLHPRYPVSTQAPMRPPHNNLPNVPPQAPKSYLQNNYANHFASNIRPTDEGQNPNITKDCIRPPFGMPVSPHLSTGPSSPVSAPPISGVHYPQHQNTMNENNIPFLPHHMMNKPRFQQQPAQQPIPQQPPHQQFAPRQFIPPNQQQIVPHNYSLRYQNPQHVPGQSIQNSVRFPPQNITNQPNKFPQQQRVPIANQQVQPVNVLRHPPPLLPMPPTQPPVQQRFPTHNIPNQPQFGRNTMVIQRNQIPSVGPQQHFVNSQLSHKNLPSSPQPGYNHMSPHLLNRNFSDSMHEPDISQNANLPPPLIPERSDVINDLSPVLPRTSATPVAQNKQVVSQVPPDGINVTLNSLSSNQNGMNNRHQLPNVFAQSSMLQTCSANQFPQSIEYTNSLNTPVNDLILPRPLQQQSYSSIATAPPVPLRNEFMNSSVNNAPVMPMERRSFTEQNARHIDVLGSPTPHPSLNSYNDSNPAVDERKLLAQMLPVPSQTSVGISYASYPTTNVRSIQAGVLFASKPMMSPSSDPVVSNILGRNENKTQELAQLGFQQFQLQQTVLQQQQQLISILQSQRSMQNLQRTEEDSKIQTLQAQISNQQQVIETLMVEQKEKKQQDNTKRLEEEHRLKEKEQEQAIEKLQGMITFLLKQSNNKSNDQETSSLQPKTVTPINNKSSTSEISIFPPDYPSVTGTVLNSNPSAVSSLAISPDLMASAPLDEMNYKLSNDQPDLLDAINDIPKVIATREVPAIDTAADKYQPDQYAHTGISDQPTETISQQKPFYEPTIDSGEQDNVQYVSNQSVVIPQSDEVAAPCKDDDAKKLSEPTDITDAVVSGAQKLPESYETIRPEDAENIDVAKTTTSNQLIPVQKQDDELPSSNDKIPSVLEETTTISSESVGEIDLADNKDVTTANDSESSIQPSLPTTNQEIEIPGNVNIDDVATNEGNSEKSFTSPLPSCVAFKPLGSPPVVNKIIKSNRKISNKSSPNISSRSSPNLSARSSPILGVNGQVVQLDDMDTKERTLSNLIDHKHLARQLGRMSFYVGEPDEAVWRNYIKELEACTDKLREECKDLCKTSGNNECDGFTKIWNDLAEVQQLDIRSYTTIEGQANVTKNRYRDILPWDHSRVILKTLSSDYINASLIENLTPLSPRYIATQGPIPQCFEDFWTMVWEQKSSVIVMLTNEVEGHKLKCHPYWCREIDVPATYGQMVVIMMEEQVQLAWKLRTFTLLNKKEEETRIVRQLQFTSWPDYGTPETPYELLLFTEEVFHLHQTEDPSFAYPLILHCSAGVGRTGSFCCIYSAIREIEGQNNLIEIPGVVRKLRQCRQHMVQRKEQLIFCYQAIVCFAQQFIAAERLKLDSPLRQHSRSMSSEDSLFASASSMSFQAMKQPYSADKIFRQKSNRADKNNTCSDKAELSDSLIKVNIPSDMPNYPSLGIVPCTIPSEQLNHQPPTLERHQPPMNDDDEEMKTVADQANLQASGATPKFKINSGIFQIAKTPASEQAVLPEQSSQSPLNSSE